MQEQQQRIVDASLARAAEAESVIANTRTAQEDYNAQVARLTVLLREGRIDQDTFNRALAKADETLQDAASSTDHLAEGFDRGLKRAISGSIRDFRDLGRVALSVLEDIIRAQITAASIGSSLSSGIGGIVGAVGGFLGFGGASGGSLAPVAAGLAGAGALPGAQHGGDFTVGGPHGTDQSVFAVRATRGEEVSVRTSRQQAGGAAGGGVTIIQHNDFTGSSPGTVAAASRFMDRLIQRSVQAVTQAMQDGGSVAVASGRRGRIV